MSHSQKHKQLSKFLSLVLRHKPEAAGLSLDPSGWVDVEELMAKMNQQGRLIDRETLVALVEHNDKQRFAFNEDQSRIRANQGHSVKIDLGYEAKTPPDRLYHGTAKRFLDSIFREGLTKRSRHHVHLSADVDTALKVGKRHGTPVILHVRAKEMQEAGFAFFQSENGVWLTDHVPVTYLVKEDR